MKSWKLVIQLGFPRDGTSRGTSRCPFVPGQKKILVPVSSCPGTRAGANVPWQTPLSRPVPGQNNLKIFKKRTRFPILEHHFSVLEHPFLFYNVLFCFRASFFCFRPSFSDLSHFVPRPVPVFGCPGPSRPGFWLSRPVPSLGKIFSLSRCPFVPGQWWNFCPVVPKSFTVPSRWKR